MTSLDSHYVSDWGGLGSIYWSAFCCSQGFFLVGFLIPIIAYSMGASGIQVALIFSLLTLGSAMFSPAAGKIAKKGRRRMSISLGAFARAFAYTGMAVSIWLSNINLLIFNSLVWGFGAAFYRVGSDAEISDRVISENKAEAFGRREAMNARGSIMGAFVGFSLTMTFLGIENLQTLALVSPFIYFAIMNVVGAALVAVHRPPLHDIEVEKKELDMSGAIAVGIAALVAAAAIDAFGMALLSPFVELFILERFTTSIEIVAFVYLPPGIASAILGGSIGKYADKSNKILIVALASMIGAITNLFLIIAPDLWMLASIFMVQTIIGVAGYTVLASVFGTAYEGRASEGFGWFGGVLGMARFSGPIIGGMLWDFVNPAAPFILIAITEILLVPIYYIGMKKYELALQQRT